MLPVRLAALKPGVHHLHFTPTADDLGLDPALFGDVAVEARLDVGTGRIVAHLDARATAHLVCDRTLVPFDEPVAGGYDVLYTNDAALAADGDDDVRYVAPSEPFLDLADVVHDTLLLALPTRRVAPGADASDLPLSFGAASDEPDALDPRWEALRRLRDDSVS